MWLPTLATSGIKEFLKPLTCLSICGFKSIIDNSSIVIANFLPNLFPNKTAVDQDSAGETG
jgi:hypothetical protein